jgi:peptidoglycan hydrolase CwlO-like protein
MESKQHELEIRITQMDSDIKYIVNKLNEISEEFKKVYENNNKVVDLEKEILILKQEVKSMDQTIKQRQARHNVIIGSVVTAVVSGISWVLNKFI